MTSFRQDIGDESGILQLVDSLIDKLFYVHTDDETTRPNPTYITKAATCQDDPSHYQDGTHISIICYLKNWERINFLYLRDDCCKALAGNIQLDGNKFRRVCN